MLTTVRTYHQLNSRQMIVNRTFHQRRTEAWNCPFQNLRLIQKLQAVLATLCKSLVGFDRKDCGIASFARPCDFGHQAASKEPSHSLLAVFALRVHSTPKDAVTALISVEVLFR